MHFVISHFNWTESQSNIISPCWSNALVNFKHWLNSIESLLIPSSNLIFNLLVSWFIQIIQFNLFYMPAFLFTISRHWKEYFIFQAYAKKQNHDIAKDNKWCKELLTVLWFYPRMHTNPPISAYNFNLANSSSYQESGFLHISLFYC